MKMNKKTLISIIIIIILIILIVVFSIIKSTSNDNKKPQRLIDAKTFLTINNLINKSNKYSISMTNFYTTTNIYYKNIDKYKIYFITGFDTENDLETRYKTNVNYILKTNGAAYELTSLSTDNIEEYFNKYNETNISFESNDIVPTYMYTEKNKLLYYIISFKHLLNANSKEAYNYLSDTQKSKYNNIDDFKNKSQTISNDISTYIVDYKENKNNKKTIYNIKTKNNNITIIENSIMDFKIEY